MAKEPNFDINAAADDLDRAKRQRYRRSNALKRQAAIANDYDYMTNENAVAWERNFVPASRMFDRIDEYDRDLPGAFVPGANGVYDIYAMDYYDENGDFDPDVEAAAKRSKKRIDEGLAEILSWEDEYLAKSRGYKKPRPEDEDGDPDYGYDRATGEGNWEEGEKKAAVARTIREYIEDRNAIAGPERDSGNYGGNSSSGNAKSSAAKPNTGMQTNNAKQPGKTSSYDPDANARKQQWDQRNANYANRNVDARMRFDSDGDGKLSNSEIAAMQRALVDAGYDIGKTGKNKDGVDGQIGKKTKAALMDFLSKQSGPKKADVTKVDYSQPELAPRRGSANNENRNDVSYAPDKLPDDQSGDLLRDFSPRQLRDIRRRNFDNYADENFDSESDEDNEAYANGQAEINEQYDADRAERRARRREARRQRRAERRGSNSYANGGRMVTREMMQRKFGNPLISKNGNEYYLL